MTKVKSPLKSIVILGDYAAFNHTKFRTSGVFHGEKTLNYLLQTTVDFTENHRFSAVKRYSVTSDM